MAAIVKDVFGIETGFQNTLVNTFARLNLEHVVDDVNDDSLDDWADLQEDAGIKENGGPLSPFMEKELLRDADLCLDGSRFESVVGFKYVLPPQPTTQVHTFANNFLPGPSTSASQSKKSRT
jgi:hypothetical protein